MVWCGVARRGVAWRGAAWRGVAWRGVARLGIAWHNAFITVDTRSIRFVVFLAYGHHTCCLCDFPVRQHGDMEAYVMLHS